MLLAVYHKARLLAKMATSRRDRAAKASIDLVAKSTGPEKANTPFERGAHRQLAVMRPRFGSLADDGLAPHLPILGLHRHPDRDSPQPQVLRTRSLRRILQTAQFSRTGSVLYIAAHPTTRTRSSSPTYRAAVTTAPPICR